LLNLCLARRRKTNVNRRQTESRDKLAFPFDEVVRVSIGDRDVRKYLQERYGIADFTKVQELEKEKRNEIIVSCLEIGTGLRQLSRLTGVTYGVINKLNKCR
jgi:hypothetical protein